MLKELVKKVVKQEVKEESSYGLNYQLIGGEIGCRKLTEKFYDVMETDPQAKELLDIHHKDLTEIREKFFEFFSGWIGGPALFEQKYGHPRLRARHLPFPVTQQLRDQWMYCMNTALNETVEHKVLREQIRGAFGQLATHMINKEE